MLAGRRVVLKGLILLPGSLLLAAAPNSVVKNAAERLKRVSYFAFGGVGYAGVTSSGEHDFRILIAQPAEEAGRSFEEVFSAGNGAAKCYALAGLHRLGAPRFELLYNQVHSAEEKVPTMEGCIGDSSTLGALAKRIRDGKYPQAQPNQALRGSGR